MRARLVLLCVIGAVGCTRFNPAFDDLNETDTPAETTVVDTLDSSGETPLTCDIEGGEELFIELVSPCGGDDLTVYDKFHNIVSIEGSTLWVGVCSDPLCEMCEDQIPSPLIVSPIELTGLAPEQTCLHVVGRREEPDNVDSCEFEALMIETSVGGTSRVPLVVARASPVVALPPVDSSSPMTGAFNPTLVLADSCPCASYPDACCGTKPPSVYDFDIGLPEDVTIGEVVPVPLDQRQYEFWAVNAFESGECDAGLELGWALARTSSP